MPKLVSVLKGLSTTDAHIWKGSLEAEGLKVHLKNESLVNTHEVFTDIVGIVEVQVREEDFEKALEIVGKEPVESIEKQEKRAKPISYPKLITRVILATIFGFPILLFFNESVRLFNFFKNTTNLTFSIGLLGSLILVTGAAWPIEKKLKQPTKSIKNWLFAIGGVIMLAYSYLGYLEGASVFFVFLESLVVLASLLMMLNTPDKIDTLIIALTGLAFIAWSLYLFEGYNTVFFILGLSGVGLGYAFEMATLRRSIALTLGSALIALFSYIEASWIFFWLNGFFAIFSAYYVYLGLSNRSEY